MLQRGGLGETYNIGGDNQPTNLEVVRHICAILDELEPGAPHIPHASLIQYVPDRPGHDRRYAMDITRIQDELGWQPRHTWKAGLRKTVDWYLSNQAWVTAVQRGSDYEHWVYRNYAKRGEGH